MLVEFNLLSTVSLPIPVRFSKPGHFMGIVGYPPRDPVDHAAFTMVTPAVFDVLDSRLGAKDLACFSLAEKCEAPCGCSEVMMVLAPAPALLLDLGVLNEVFSAVFLYHGLLREYEPDWHAVEIDFREGMDRIQPLFHVEVKDWPYHDTCVEWER